MKRFSGHYLLSLRHIRVAGMHLGNSDQAITCYRSGTGYQTT